MLERNINRPKGLAAGKLVGLWPFVGLLTVVGALFAIGGTVVLALIPTYLSKPDLTVSNSSALATFYMLYSASSTDDSAVSGTVTDSSSISSSLGLSDLVSVSSGQSYEAGERRRRDTGSQRYKREVGHNVFLVCTPKVIPSCANAQCMSNYLNSMFTKIRQRSNSSKTVPMSVVSSGNLTRHTFIFSNPIFFTTRPARFDNGNTTVFVAVRSGFFNSSTTWSNEIIPYGNGSVLIPSGVTVTIPRGSLRTPLSGIDVYGTLELGANSNQFQFYGSLALTIYGGGLLRDLTINKTILMPSSSVFFRYPNGSLSDNNTVIQNYDSQSRAIRTGSRYAIGSSSTRTIALLSDFSVLEYTQIAFVAIKSGSFFTSSTYLRGIAISSTLCNAAGGCTMAVTSGVTVATSDIGDSISFPLSNIEVLNGGTMSLGSSSSNNAFSFTYPVNFKVNGLLRFLGLSGQIRLPPSSQFNILSSGSFSSSISTSLITYSSSGGTLSTFTLGSSYSSQLNITSSNNGSFTQNQGGGSNFTTMMPPITNMIG